MKKLAVFIGFCLILIFSSQASGGNYCSDWWPYHEYPWWHPWYPCPREEPSPYEDLKFESAGELVIVTEPSQVELEVKIYVDGYLLNSAEGQSLLVGKHHIEIRAEGYKPHFEEVEIQTAKRTILTIILEKEEGK